MMTAPEVIGPEFALEAALQQLSLAPSRAALSGGGVVPLTPPHTRLLQDLRAEDWQLVTGRRGTGKTQLARHFTSAVNQDRDQRTWAIAVSADNLLISPIGVQLSPRQRARSIFQMLVRQLAESLNADAPELLARSVVRRGRRKNLQADVSRALLQMIDASDEGYALTAGGTRSFEELIERVDARESSREAGIAATVTKESLGGEFKAGIRRARSTQSTNQLKEVVQYPAAALLTGIRGALEIALAILGIERLLIVIDSVTSIGADQDPDVQPCFYHDLRRGFAGSSAISVKLFANPFQLELTRPSPQDRFGLLIGTDVHHLRDLDALLEEQLDRNLARVLHQHLCYYATRPDLPAQATANLFDSPATFELMLAGFGTNISHLLSAMRRLTQSRVPTPRRPWTGPEVQAAIYENTRLVLGGLTHRRADVIQAIVQSAGAQNQVSVSEELARDIGPDLLDLAERGLIDYERHYEPPTTSSVATIARHVRVPRPPTMTATNAPPLVMPAQLVSPAPLSIPAAATPRQCPSCEADDRIVTTSTGKLVCTNCFWELDGPPADRAGGHDR